MRICSILAAGCLSAVASALEAVPPAVSAPEHFIDLDKNPRDRWTEAIAPHAVDIQKLIDTWIPLRLLREAIAAIPLGKLLPAEIHEEVIGVSAALGIPVNDAAAMNLVYDITAFCTSIVAQDSSGRIVHGRNLDYSSPEQLQNVTLVAHFRSNNCTSTSNPKGVCFSTTTYAGFVGALTGVKPGAFSVSLDERDTSDDPEEPKHQTPINNMLSALLNGGRSSSLLLRELLSSPNSTFDSALRKIVSTPLAAPVYLILGGTHNGQGAVVARDRVATKDVWTLTGDKWYVLETNYERWVPAPRDDNRRGIAEVALSKIGPHAISKATLYEVLSTPPVLNNGTTYTTTMSAADAPGTMSTMVRYDNGQSSDPGMKLTGAEFV